MNINPLFAPIVISARGHTCQTSSHVPLPLPSGYIANVVTEETGCGAEATPWYIEAKRGQRINFTLYDYALPADGSVSQPGTTICYLYALITEPTNGHKINVCGNNGQRTRQVYVTVSHTAEVRVVRKQDLQQKGYFVLEYERK